METAIGQVDKAQQVAIEGGHGSITIRVVVLEKGMAASAGVSAGDDPLDATPDELLPDSDKKPITSFLEEPKRGRQVCVFLINGQRQHAWDNQFIIRDLGLKYLRSRMIVVIDCDGLKPEAISELMQGSRSQFYDGHVYAALEQRVIATLKGDPDLRKLEEQAEDEIANLRAGDEVVKAALDQLIEAHDNAASHTVHGQSQAGDATRYPNANGTLQQTESVVMDAESGEHASEPVLLLRPETSTIRLKPNEDRRMTLTARPESDWEKVEGPTVTFDPPVKELQVTRTSQGTSDDVVLKFVESEEFDEDEYPIVTTLRVMATFQDVPGTRVLERRLVITPAKSRDVQPVPKPLLDDPTFVKVTSRQPIKLVIGGADVHVKMRWDGKDELLTLSPPMWSLTSTCETPSVEPHTFLTRPVNGRFEFLIQVPAGITAGEQLKFDIEAMGPGKTLSTAFLADVVEPISPRKTTAKLLGGGQRRPPYELKYIDQSEWSNPDLACFGEPWNATLPGAFEPPSINSPLTIFINTDMDQLVVYRESLIARKLAESTIHQRINKYTAHVAYHLYQMYLKQRNTASRNSDQSDNQEEWMQREEIQRVAHTLIKLMEVI